MNNLDRIMRVSFIRNSEDTRQFYARLDALKDKEQDEMWDFIHHCLRAKRKRAKDQREKEIDIEGKIR